MVKIGRAIAITAFAALATFLVISASTVYITTENDLKSLQVDFAHMVLNTNGSAYIVMKVNGSNSGFLPSSVSVMNKQFTINPESSLAGNLSIPANFSKFQNMGWPVNDVSILMKIFLSSLMGGFNLSSSNKTIFADIPPLFSNASLYNKNNGSIFNMIIYGLIPVVATFFYVAVYVGSKFVGNMTPSSQNGLFSGNLSLFGNLNLTKSQLNQTTFRLGGTSWNF